MATNGSAFSNASAVVDDMSGIVQLYPSENTEDEAIVMDEAVCVMA